MTIVDVWGLRVDGVSGSLMRRFLVACLFMFAKGKFPCIVTFVIYSQV